MTKLEVVLVLIAVATIAVAYDYSDSTFNQYLADDLTDLNRYLENSDYFHVRNRRDEEAVMKDEKCRHRRKKICCAEETFEEMQDKDKEMKRECFKEIVSKDKNRDERGGSDLDPFRCDKVEKRRKEMTCILQCVGKKKGILDAEGKPLRDEIAILVNEIMIKENWFIPLQEKVISTCFDEAKNASASRDTTDTDSCNPAGVKLKHCLFREIQLGCPAAQIKDLKACQKARDKISKNDEWFPAPAFMNDE